MRVLVLGLCLSVTLIIPFAAAARGPGQEVVLLAPAIAEAQSTPRARGSFYQNVVTVQYRGGRVVLSSNAAGDGRLRTDDAVVITVQQPDRTARTFNHDFRRADGSYAVGETAPADLTALFGTRPKVVTVTIELRDLTPPVCSSRAYYLVLTGIPVTATTAPSSTPTRPSTPTALPSPTTAPSSTPTWTPTLIPTVTWSPTATSTPVPSLTSTHIPTPSPTATSPTVPTVKSTPSATSSPGAAGKEAGAGRSDDAAPHMPLVVALVLPALGVVVLWRWRARNPIPGSLDLYEDGKWVATYVLPELGRCVILGRVGDLMVQSTRPRAARISSVRAEEGVRAEIEALDREQPVEIGGEPLSGTHRLRHGDEIRIGGSVLRYTLYDLAD